MRTSRYLSALVCLVSLLWRQPAIAQDFAEQRGQFSVGTLSFTPSTLLLFGHDTNLIRAVGAPPGSEVFDVAQVEAWWKPGRLRMSGALALESERELGNAGTTSWNNAEELNVYTLTGRLRPSFSFNRHNHYAPPSDFSGYEAGLKSRRIETQAEGRLSMLVGASTQFVTSSRLTSIAYDADARFQNVSLQDNLNKTGRVVAASLEHSLTRQTTLFEQAEIGQDRYERTPLRNGTPSFVGVGARSKSAALLEGSAFIGWRMYRSKTSALDNYSGLNWQANIAVSRPRFTVLFDARRDFYPSYGAALRFNSRYRSRCCSGVDPSNTFMSLSSLYP